MSSGYPFLQELRRRHVFRAAAFYAAAAFVVLQAADLMLPALHLPGWTFTFLVVLALLGLPVVLALAWALEVGREGVHRAEPAVASRPARIGFTAVAATALAAGTWVALGGGGGLEPTGEGDLASMVVSEVLPPTGRRFDGGAVLSPDGRHILFSAVDSAGSRSLWIRPLDGLKATAVPDTERAHRQFWSPDGRSIAFFADGALWRLDLDGGARTRLCDAPDPGGGTWSGDGTIVFSTGTVYRVPAGGGECRAAPLPPANYLRPTLLSDGRRALLWIFGSDRGTGDHVAVADLESGEVRKLLPGADPVLVAPRLVAYHRGGTVYAHRLDRRGREFVGEPVALVEGVHRNAFRAQFTVAGSTLLYTRVRREAARRWVADRRGEPVYSIAERGWTFALGSARPWAVAGGFGLHLVDLERATSTVLESQYALHPVFSPGDSLLAYHTGLYTGMCRVTMRSVESGMTTTVYEGSPCFQQSDWTPDGTRLVGTLAAADSGGFTRIALLDVRTGKLEPILGVVGNAAEGVVSRDGRWLAYSSDEGGRPEVFVRPFLRAGSPTRISREGGRTPRWRADGRELYFASPRGDLMMVAIGEGASLQDSPPVRLFAGGWPPFSGLGENAIFTVNGAGTRFLLSHPADDLAASLPLVLVHGWPGLLEGSGR